MNVASNDGMPPLPDERHPVVLIPANGNVRRLTSLANVAVYPGSFNPVHEGHRRLKTVAEQILGLSVVFELSVTNVDKPALTFQQLHRRLNSLRSDTVVLTRAPLFSEKSLLFPGCTFVVGFDTAERIIDPRFYENDPGRVAVAMETLASRGHRFLVGGRMLHESGSAKFRTARDLQIPPPLQKLFEAIPEHLFRADISSTQLRGEDGLSDVC